MSYSHCYGYWGHMKGRHGNSLYELAPKLLARRLYMAPSEVLVHLLDFILALTTVLA